MSGDGTLELTVGSFNLHGGRNSMGRTYAVTAALERLAADVIVLQENWRPHGEESIARQAARTCGYPHIEELDLLADTALYQLGLVRDRTHDQPGTWGLAVASRLPLVSTDPVWLGHAPGDPSARAAQVLEVPNGQRPALRLVNIHLTHRLRYGPAQLLRLLRSLRARPETPTVVAGDFNMCRPAIYLARGYRRAVRGRTWPAERPLAQLDHLLISPEVRVTQAEAMADLGSDHRPVVAVLRI